MIALVLIVLAQPYPTIISVRNPTETDGGQRVLNVTSPASAPSHVILDSFDGGVSISGTVSVIVRNQPPAPTRNPLTGAAKVEVVSIPLPAGAAQENGNLAAILVALGLDGGMAAAQALIAANQTNGAEVVRVSNMPPPPMRSPLTGAAKVDGSGVVQPVSATSLPLPAGAAMEDGGNLAAILKSLAALGNGQQSTSITYTSNPINPFLPRCNAVRRTNCQP